MTEDTCQTEGCGSPVLARHLCRTHYMADRANRAPQCTVRACDQPELARQMCRRHYRIWRQHGDPTYQRPPKKPRVRTPRPPSTTYVAVHLRITKRRGRARDHACAACGAPASDWAYDHTDPDELTGVHVGKTVVYSADIERYRPLCRACHNREDTPYEGGVLQRHNWKLQAEAKARRDRLAAVIAIDPSPRPKTRW